MTPSRARTGVIFFTVLIDLIGFGIVMPILPFYAQRFGAGGFRYGVVLGVYSFMQFVATALLGKLSDRIGRRPVLLTTMLVNAVGYTLFAFAGSYWVLFLSRVVATGAPRHAIAARPATHRRSDRAAPAASPHGGLGAGAARLRRVHRGAAVARDRRPGMEAAAAHISVHHHWRDRGRGAGLRVRESGAALGRTRAGDRRHVRHGIFDCHRAAIGQFGVVIRVDVRAGGRQ